MFHWDNGSGLKAVNSNTRESPFMEQKVLHPCPLHLVTEAVQLPGLIILEISGYLEERDTTVLELEVAGKMTCGNITLPAICGHG